VKQIKASVRRQKDVIRDTKKHIINAARHLFSDFSYLGVSMDDIAKKLNITKAALYYHFKGKEEIYKKVLDDDFSDLSLLIMEALKETTIEKKLQKLIKNYLDFGYSEKSLIKAAMIEITTTDSRIKNCIIQFRKQIFDMIQTIVEDMITYKKITREIDSKLLTSLIIGMVDGILLEYSILNRRIDAKSVSSQISTFILKAVVQDNPMKEGKM